VHDDAAIYASTVTHQGQRPGLKPDPQASLGERTARCLPGSLLGQHQFYGALGSRTPSLNTAFTGALESLLAHGLETTLEAYIGATHRIS
jgi:hypothetical protein